jgi:MFS family permease
VAAFINRFGVEQADGKKILPACRVSVITATRTVASIPAVFACQILGNKWGRKRTIWFGCATCLLGTALQTGSVNEAMITIGLTIASTTITVLAHAGIVLTAADFGYFTMVSMASTLIIEISPPSIRGVAGALSAVAVSPRATMLLVQHDDHTNVRLKDRPHGLPQLGRRLGYLP